MTSNTSELFFSDLKQYNSTNFRTLAQVNVSDNDNSTLHKSFSSVVTRYFIFREKHPEIDENTMKMLYYKLKIDMVARYFSEYPAASPEDLRPFQIELQNYVRSSKEA